MVLQARVFVSGLCHLFTNTSAPYLIAPSLMNGILGLLPK